MPVAVIRILCLLMAVLTAQPGSAGLKALTQQNGENAFWAEPHRFDASAAASMTVALRTTREIVFAGLGKTRVPPGGAGVVATNREVLIPHSDLVDIFEIWSISKPARSIALDDGGGTLFIGFEDGSVEAVDIATGRTRWQGVQFTRPVVGLDAFGDTLMAVDEDAGLVLLSARSGERVGALPPDHDLVSRGVPHFVILEYSTARIAFKNGQIRSFQRFGAPRWTRDDDLAANAVGPKNMTIVRRTARLDQPSTTAVVSVCAACPKPPVEFPWPPPSPSTMDTLDLDALMAGGVTDMKGLDRALRAALDAAGYGGYRYYYGPPGGYVMLTQLERIASDGTPAEPRWDLDAAPAGAFSILGFLKSFAGGERGRYRIIAFALAADAGPDHTAPTPTRADAEAWFLNGDFSLAKALGDKPLDPGRHSLYALIYEFTKKSKQGGARVVRPSGILADDHLRAAQILDNLP